MREFLIQTAGERKSGNKDGEADLLGGNVEGEDPHVDLGVAVHTGDDEEDPRAPGASLCGAGVCFFWGWGVAPKCLTH